MNQSKIKLQAEQMRKARARWTLTDPVKADVQMERNRALRISLEQTSSSGSSKR